MVIMKRLFICCWFIIQHSQNGICDGHVYEHSDEEIAAFFNRTTPSDRPMYDFKLKHQEPIGLLTTSSGLPVELREMTALNVNQYKDAFQNDLSIDYANAKIPARSFHAKGTGAWGYFEVTHDVSKYTSADVFNGIGKKTLAFARLSTNVQNRGGNDVTRELKGFSLKLYTKEGNLDFLGIQTAVIFFMDSILLPSFVALITGNPKTNVIDYTMTWDFLTKRAESLHALFWILSDYGIPNGYRKSDYFPIHPYETRNKYGDRYFVKFNFRSCQGIDNLPSEEARLLGARDSEYYTRDLYDAIENKNYPAWDLEMDVLSFEEVLRCDYNPFDITRLWKKGTYRTVPIGRLVLNKNPDNYFRDVELSAFNPGNLVPGLPGPIDSFFRSRRHAYRVAQSSRLGINHNRINVNVPLYRKEYNVDGLPPVLENMKDSPAYFPNSFNGPVPYLETERPKDSLSVLHSKAVDLEPASYFYRNYIVTEEEKGRFVNNTVDWMLSIAPYMQRRVIRLFSLIDPDLGKRLTKSLFQAEEAPGFTPPDVLIPLKRKIL